MKRKPIVENFGKRLAQFRRSKGFTQSDLGKKIGVSQRVIAYYEGETAYPPTHLLIPMSKALKVNVDKLLGLKDVEIFDPYHTKFWNKLKKTESLSRKDKKALLDFIDALLVRSKKIKLTAE